MKKLILALGLLVSTSALATQGIDCQDVEGSLEVWTTEASVEGDNLISISAKVGNRTINFTQVASNSDYPHKIYMGSNTVGESIVLELNTGKREGMDMSTIYLNQKGSNITKETSMLCVK
jgi:hypothetical protein